MAKRLTLYIMVGMALGLVGNSGMSTEPHLHYQLMDAPDWRRAHGLVPTFVDLLVDGVATHEAQPRRGAMVQAAPREASR